MEKKQIKIILTVLTLAFFALSFAPCIIEIHEYLIGSDLLEESFVEYLGYCPSLCAVISAIELLLLFRSNKMWSQIVRLILILIKTAAPLPLIKLMAEISPSFIGGLTRVTYSYNWIGYLLIGFGSVLFILNLVELLLYRSSNAGLHYNS